MIRPASLFLLLFCLACAAGAGANMGNPDAVSPIGAWFCHTGEGGSTLLLREDGSAVRITVAAPGAQPESAECTWSQTGGAVILKVDGDTSAYIFDSEALTLTARETGLVYEPSEELTDLVPREEASPQPACGEGNSPLRAIGANP